MPFQPSQPSTAQRDSAALPTQPFFASAKQRTALARERFFERGERPTGLVSETLLQSWSRCVAARRDPAYPVAFEPVSRSHLKATLERNRALLAAAGDEIARLEAAVGGSACRVLLTDANGVIVHATAAPASDQAPALRQVARLGVNLAEAQVGTNAPAVVVKTGAACTVLGGEHFFDCIATLHCAAAPIRDGQGRLAGVLDLTLEARPFAFDAAALVGVVATVIENRLLQAAAGALLLLQFQVDASLLDTPLQALAGIDGQGRLAWLNGTAQKLLGGGLAGAASGSAGAGGQTPAGSAADDWFGCSLHQLLAQAGRGAFALPLPNGLTVWARVRPPMEPGTA
jgi:transcriptional regulator of acetoin/glycerol metabolism